MGENSRMPEKVHTRFGESPPIEVRPVNGHSSKASDANAPSTKRKADDAFPKSKESSKENGKIKARRPSGSDQSERIVNFLNNELNEVEANSGRSEAATATSNPRESQAPGTGTLRDRAKSLLSTRRQLPIYPYAQQIRQSLRDSDVLLLVGETGSGKSTQIPQFLLHEPWCQARTVVTGSTSKSKSVEAAAAAATKRTKFGGRIAITQPRRLAATSLASRVAAEVGTPLGNSSPASTVGYSVRFDRSVSASTRIKFLTEGMLLQEMLRDPWLKEYSCVIVDEVHERGVDVDLVLGFLRRLVAGGKTKEEGRDGREGVPLKVVVMSATAEMDAIRDFFDTTRDTDPPIANIKDSQNPSHEQSTSDDDEWAGFSDIEPTSRPKEESVRATTPRPVRVTTLHIPGRQYPVTMRHLPEPTTDLLSAALSTIIQIHTTSPLPGDILVFLTGQEMIENLSSLLHNYIATTLSPATSRTKLTAGEKKAKQFTPRLPGLQVLPLYASLPPAQHQAIFTANPAHTRRCILSTNIAETSLTVPRIAHVVDTGLCKMRRFRAALALDSLLVAPISQSSAAQRAGRAGRDALGGTCHRLYTAATWRDVLPPRGEPEMLRCDLAHTVLQLKARGVADVAAFPFLTPPPRPALQRALVSLLQLGALDANTGALTATGAQMARLPLPPPLARVLLAAAEPQLACLAECVDVVAALSVGDSVFVNLAAATATGGAGLADSERREAIEEARRVELFRREGDHLTLLATVRAYIAEQADRRAWCSARGVSHRAMLRVVQIRKQLLGMTDDVLDSRNSRSSGGRDASNGGGGGDDNNNYNSGEAEDVGSRVLRAFVAGFAVQTARLSRDGTTYHTMPGNAAIAIHPSSVLFGGRERTKKPDVIVYNEFVFTQKPYARGVSAVHPSWLLQE